MNTSSLSKGLQSSSLYAECPCGQGFLLKDALLFDGTRPFPAEALPARQLLESELKEMIEALKKRHVSAAAGAEKKAIEVGVGKCLEKIMPVKGLDGYDIREWSRWIYFTAFFAISAIFFAMNFVE